MFLRITSGVFQLLVQDGGVFLSSSMAGTKLKQPARASCIEAAALRTPVCIEQKLGIPCRYEAGFEFITGSFPQARPAVDPPLLYVDFTSDGEHMFWV